jgi:diguanylate cyclase (GGDEF)-like protein
VGRCGGEAFLVVVPESTGSAEEGIYERIRAHIAEYRVKTGSIELGITMSIGVATLENGTTLDTIIGAADAALHRAKKAGRNRVCYSTAPTMLNRVRARAVSCG